MLKDTTMAKAATIEEKPWNTKRSFSRDDATKRYSQQDPEQFLRSNWGVKQDDGSWIINHSLILRKKSPIVKNGRFIVKLKRINGNFNCAGQGLVTLEGGPEYVEGNFWCGSNPLKNLKHGPKYVGGIYDCAECYLTSLKSLELTEIHDELNVSYNKLTSLKSLPRLIHGDLYAEHNKLTSFKDMPVVKKDIHAGHNPFETLKGLIFADDSIVDFGSFLEHRLTKTESDFGNIMIADNKRYVNYHDMLFKYAVKKEAYEDIKEIKWPDNFWTTKRKNLISSKQAVAKFRL